MTEAASVRIDGLSKQYRAGAASVQALKDINLNVAKGELVVLLGASGCGKTTLLRCVAGLERPDAGNIGLGGRTVFSHSEQVFVRPERRQLSMMFQSYALWSHMAVFENVAYPLRNRRVETREIVRRVERTLEMVGCKDLQNRYPGQLSGGQQQRVALARAIVSDDQLILFDEPLSAVDAKVREQVRSELLALQSDLKFSALYVTHDQAEAIALADRIVVMRGGQIEQVGSPREIYEAPATLYVARFVGTTNTIDGAVAGCRDGLVRFKSSLGDVWSRSEVVPPCGSVSAFAMIRPERVRLVEAHAESEMNSWRARIQRVSYAGSFTEICLKIGDQGREILCHQSQPCTFEAGDEVSITLDPDWVRIVYDR